jgi:hypothetical protein
MELLLGIVFLGVVFVVLWKTAAWILRPLDEAARGRELPMQFTLGDFLGLVFLMQVPTWALMLDRRLAWPIVVFGWIAFGLMWLFGVHTLSRAGVENPWHRVLFVAVVIPGSVCATIALPAVAMGLIVTVFEPRGGPPALAVLVGVVLLGCALYGLGLSTRWMLAGRKAGEPLGPASRNAPMGSGPLDASPAAPPDPFADDDEPTVTP